MALSLDDIQRIAHLARIEITPAEAAAVGAKLDAIFAMIGRMSVTGAVSMATSVPVPTMIAVGVARPMAHGQAMMSTATALTIA